MSAGGHRLLLLVVLLLPCVNSSHHQASTRTSPCSHRLTRGLTSASQPLHVLFPPLKNSYSSFKAQPKCPILYVVPWLG